MPERRLGGRDIDQADRHRGSGIFDAMVHGDDPALTRKCAELYFADESAKG